MTINRYLSQLFIPALTQHAIPEEQAAEVAKDVGARLHSIISRWNDEDFRRTLLTVGREEATYYQPLQADIEVRALVVMAVRNSALEDISSVDQAARLYGLPQAVALDAYMSQITGAAITYFAELNLDVEATRHSLPVAGSDPFLGLAERYPAAWTALSHLANPAVVKRTYQPVKTLGQFPVLSNARPERTKLRPGLSVIQSGMSLGVNAQLRTALDAIASEAKKVFFTPSFKHLTRHPGKLFELIEYALHHGAAVVSPNFYLSNGYVARRPTLLRPMHYERELVGILREAITGTKGTHRQALEAITVQLPVA